MFNFSNGIFLIIKFIKMLPTEEPKEHICSKPFPALLLLVLMAKSKGKNISKITWENIGKVILSLRDNKLIKITQG